MIFTTADHIGIHYDEDYFGPPWSKDSAETIMLVHGIAESNQVWYDWIPRLATIYRLIRVDLPGFGQSRVPSDKPYSWEPPRLASDLHELAVGLKLKRFHLVGAKYGGSIVVQFAADYPEMLASLSVVGGPVRVVDHPSDVAVAKFSDTIRSKGMRQWADQSMDKRLGTKVTPGHRQWWVEMMANSDPRATGESCDAVARLNLMPITSRMSTPSLFITTENSPLIHIGPYRQDIGKIRNASLLALPGDAYHPATMHATESIAAITRHISQHRYT